MWVSGTCRHGGGDEHFKGRTGPVRLFLGLSAWESVKVTDPRGAPRPLVAGRNLPPLGGEEINGVGVTRR
ncbi:protein of unknown function [Kyrpidia spormannii]|uniref:Uncharacterized protein n=1 Tax=Kyrpidia spormannii TaxID=2055160 RepID=A0ACA8ZCZ0_9BACL|nr:protein of unknown function [Kyrpidia spormannii]